MCGRPEFHAAVLSGCFVALFHQHTFLSITNCHAAPGSLRCSVCAPCSKPELRRATRESASRARGAGGGDGREKKEKQEEENPPLALSAENAPNSKKTRARRLTETCHVRDERGARARGVCASTFSLYIKPYLELAHTDKHKAVERRHFKCLKLCFPFSDFHEVNTNDLCHKERQHIGWYMECVRVRRVPPDPGLTLTPHLSAGTRRFRRETSVGSRRCSGRSSPQRPYSLQ